MSGGVVVPPPSRRTGPAARPEASEPAVVLRPGPTPSVVDVRDGATAPDVEQASSIDIRWSDEGACTVELRGRPTRAMLTEAREILWSRTPSDRLTVVVTHAVLTR